MLPQFILGITYHAHAQSDREVICSSCHRLHQGNEFWPMIRAWCPPGRRQCRKWSGAKDMPGAQEDDDEVAWYGRTLPSRSGRRYLYAQPEDQTSQHASKKTHKAMYVHAYGLCLGWSEGWQADFPRVWSFHGSAGCFICIDWGIVASLTYHWPNYHWHEAIGGSGYY